MSHPQNNTSNNGDENSQNDEYKYYYENDSVNVTCEEYETCTSVITFSFSI
jgi:hypothetical protein